ncbi:hypothetical protein B0T25DRAFT_514433 [Lasiosphaeria hispida]|uniref:Uncharacterized protein n=1 Tax=Lasiosphaeria hispida TaxID=260671 RepID=A0AAJ0MH01_9PEZI|nr:hypothetical protein B0T25DRAFT_514433 [Lasiosphaeria hispida]
MAHYRSSSPRSRPVRISLGSGGSGSNLDHVGDYVARSLLPTMMNSSSRPMKVIMNFGHLTIEDDEPGAHHHHHHHRGARSSSPNAIIYNAPGCSLSLDKGDAGRASGSGVRRVATELVPVSDDGRRVVRRAVDRCLGCSTRQLVDTGGYCLECDAVISALLPREREYYHGHRSGAGRRGGWDAVRHIAPPNNTAYHWWRRDWRDVEREKERERVGDWRSGRWRRERRGEGKYAGYYGSDSDLGVW